MPIELRLPKDNEETTRRLYFQIVDARLRLEAMKLALIDSGAMTATDFDRHYSRLAQTLTEGIHKQHEILGILETMFPLREG